MATKKAAKAPLPKFTEMLGMPREERVKAELRFLEGLVAQAVKAKKFNEAASIFEKAQALLMREGKRA